MLGDIYRLIDGYGFILGKSDREEYFFHKTSLIGCKFDELEEGMVVDFSPARGDRGLIALNITRHFEESGIYFDTNDEVYPGIHSMVDLDSFDTEERAIVNTLGKTFYVTNGGQNIVLGTSSKYRYFLVKPTDSFSEQFNIKREIVVVFSAYENFEPRTFDAISEAYKNFPQRLRLDRICSIVISRDRKVVEKVKDILKSDVEMQVIVPFSYAELEAGDKTQLIIQRFKNHFYARDLFAFESPLKRDIYFFGRREYVHDLMNRQRSGENSGVFGLRRSGKTSVLEAIGRASALMNIICVFIDCQDLYHYRWNKALYYTLKRIAEKMQLDMPSDESEYTEESANSLFETDLELLLISTENNILLLYDEVEHISPGLAMKKEWKEGNDFIIYWQTIRSNYRRRGEKFTFILAGTNPSAIERISINGHDNPLYNQLSTNTYLPPFSVESVKEMVNKLGGYMGLCFDDIVCASLTKDFGGHPYLIRHFCSEINTYLTKEHLTRPIKVTTAIYNAVMPIFVDGKADNYCRLITQVLQDYYPEEYKFLENLALGNSIETINSDPSIIQHLIGYGIIENNQGMLDYRIDVLKKYMSRKYSYNRQNLTLEEKWAQISERRNRVEPKLRQIVKVQMKAFYGPKEAKIRVLNSMRSDLKDKYKELNYEDLFNPSKCEVYLSMLGNIIVYNWDVFAKIFNKSKNTVKSHFTLLNDLRKECHAAPVTDDEMQTFRGTIGYFEGIIKDYFGDEE